MFVYHGISILALNKTWVTTVALILINESDEIF